MQESKKGVHQIDRNHFLFFNSPEIYYSLSFEIEESNKIRIILLKIMDEDTYIFDAVIPFSDFGTGDTSPVDTLKSVSFLIYNYNFLIKEEVNKAYLLVFSKNKKNIELFLHDQNNVENSNDLYFNEQINNLQNKIQELINVKSIQEQKINELLKKEETHINMINNMEKITSNLLNQLETQNNNNNQNNNKQYSNQYNSQYNVNNPYQTNNDYRNNITMTLPPQQANFGNINNNKNPYNPYS